MSSVLQHDVNYIFATSSSFCKGLSLCLTSQIYLNFMKLHHISSSLGMQKHSNYV